MQAPKRTLLSHSRLNSCFPSITLPSLDSLRLNMPARDRMQICTTVIQFAEHYGMIVYAHMGAFAFNSCGFITSRSKIPRCKMGVLQEAVPLEELWASIEMHCQARQAVAASQAALSDRAQQQRAVQKRLLMCFKDRQPGSLAHLELLLAETFDQLIDLGELLMLISLP
jgi:hypothetical protein